jgi:hypothetical protein
VLSVQESRNGSSDSIVSPSEGPLHRAEDTSVEDEDSVV